MPRKKPKFFDKLRYRLVDALSMADSRREIGRKSAAPLAASSTKGFEERLNRLLESKSSAISGKVHIIGLSGLRERYGDQWGPVAKPLHRATRRAIERNLSEDDFYTHFKDDYLIVFGELRKPQAQLTCALIAKEVSHWLLGEGAGLTDVSVRTVVATVDGRPRLQAVTEEVHDIVAAPRSKSLGRTAKTSPGTHAVASRPSVASARAGQRPTRRRVAPPLPLTGVASPASVAKILEDAEAPSHPPAEQAPSERGFVSEHFVGNLQFIYLPMWYVPRKVVTTYVCLPARSTDSGNLLVGEEVSPADADSTLVGRVDAETLNRVIKDLGEMSEAGSSHLIALPLHSTTLDDTAARREYIRLCRSIPKGMQKMLVIELVGFPFEERSTRLMGELAVLRDFSRALIARLPLDGPRFDWLGEARLFAVGVDLLSRSAPEATLLRELERFAEAASGCGLKTYVHGLGTLSLTTAAICAGFDYVDGEAITSLVDAPRGVYPLAPENLYAHLLPDSYDPTAGRRSGAGPTRVRTERELPSNS